MGAYFTLVSIPPPSVRFQAQLSDTKAVLNAPASAIHVHLQFCNPAPVRNKNPCAERSSSEPQGQQSHRPSEAIHRGALPLLPSRGFLTRKRPDLIILSQRCRYMTHQPLLMMQHPEKGFWRGGRACLAPMQLTLSSQAVCSRGLSSLQEGKAVLPRGQIGPEHSKGLNDSPSLKERLAPWGNS